MKEFSKQEFFRGLAACLFVPVSGANGFCLALASGLLWMLGGTYWKPIRRFGIPTVILVYVANFNGFRPWHLVAYLLGIAVLHLGDGFPDHRATTADLGSALGRFIEKIAVKRIDLSEHYDQKFLDFLGEFTKWLIPVIFWVSLIPYWIGR